MDYKKQIERYLEKSGGIITASYCRSKKIPTVYLSRLVQEGTLQRAAEGLYISEEGMYDDYYYFQYRFKKAVFSHETALYLLGATDKIPQDMDVTVYYSYKFNEAPFGVNIHYVNKEIHGLGVVEARTMFNNPVRVYSYERTLCDFIAHKDKMDREVYVKLIRSYSKYARRDVHALYEIATRMGIDKEVKALMEVVYE
ncbi:MAG: type IV toxin-antitoxin system AbiEi family antitoxin domain-containing protein [Spirochaetales bacterium]|nr:type IV toxin-antitoxin system AbiEi family antitoxin domain-containing protein [Spirochaetales bacterium]